ncbi:hypothetical protein O4H61_09765 [Roseovarius aestuarii]|nr:hypothetical protein [Roseovarius aestuarii]
MTHNFKKQRAETYAVFADVQAQSELPDFADIDYAFVPLEGADWDGAEAALNAAEFECSREEDDDGAPYLGASLADQPVTALAIWLGEEAATQILLPFRFVPDGWGFMA